MELSQNGYYSLPPGKIAAVVTFLEMTGPPPPRIVPPDPALSLCRVERPDLGWYRDLYGRVGGEWLWFSRLLMPDEALRAILWDPLVEVHALSHAGADKGLLELDRREPGEIELAFFGLTPDLVGRGAGRFLMSCALALACQHRAHRLWVHTCTLDHPAALGFYIRSGFRPYKRAVEIADDPRLLGRLPRTAASWLPLIGDQVVTGVSGCAPHSAQEPS